MLSIIAGCYVGFGFSLCLLIGGNIGMDIYHDRPGLFNLVFGAVRAVPCRGCFASVHGCMAEARGRQPLVSAPLGAWGAGPQIYQVWPRAWLSAFRPQRLTRVTNCHGVVQGRGFKGSGSTLAAQLRFEGTLTHI